MVQTSNSTHPHDDEWRIAKLPTLVQTLERRMDIFEDAINKNLQTMTMTIMNVGFFQ